MVKSEDLKKLKKPGLFKLGEYSLAIPALLVGAYYLFAEDLVRDTARIEAEAVVDSVVHSEDYEKIDKQLEILTNYMKLQNPELYEKAKSLEED